MPITEFLSSTEININLGNSKKEFWNDDSLGYKNPLDKSNETNKYDIPSQRYLFNIIEVSIPSSVNKNEMLNFVNKHLFERNIYYSKANHTVNSNKRDVKKTCDEILKILEKNGL